MAQTIEANEFATNVLSAQESIKMKLINKNRRTKADFKLPSNGSYSTPELRRKVHLSKHVCLHISEVSAVMVGICQAGVGLIHIASTLEKIDTYIDDLLAFDSLIFTIACITAFWAFRSTKILRTLRVSWISETFFMIGLG
jgi:hypothetical protein